MEIIRTHHMDEVVTPDGVVITSVEDRTTAPLRHKLGDLLSQLTMEDGMVLPEGTKFRRSLLRKAGPVLVSKTVLGSRPWL